MSGKTDRRHETVYSDRIAGDAGQYHATVSFSRSPGGYVHVVAFADDGDRVSDSVLLSPAQMRALVAFAYPRRKLRTR